MQGSVLLLLVTGSNGGLLLGLLEVFMTNFAGSSLQPAFTFLFAIIFLIFRPQGISGKFVKEKV